MAVAPGGAAANPPLIEDTRALWEREARSKDSERVGRLYAEDAWLQLPCTPLQTDRAGATDSWRELFALPNFNIVIEPESTESGTGGDIAVERGRAQFMQYIGGIPFATNADYLRVWRKTGGAWRIAADMFSRSSSCPGAAG